jgi:Flp pilus assembly protein TadG
MIARLPRPRHRSRHRHGIAIVYAAIVLVVLIAMASLAVDLGRAQCAKTELRRAADAAARYATTGIDDDTAVSKAITVAAENLVDGTPLVLNNSLAGNPKDVEVGNWDATQNPRFSTARTPRNAVRVTARRTAARGDAIPLLFGRVLGSNTCDLTATSVATRAIKDPNFIGLSNLSAKNNTSVGYDPTLGVPNSAAYRNGASIASNGSVSFDQNPMISGAVILGPDGRYNQSSPSPTRLTEDLSFPNTESPPGIAVGSLNVNGTMHITGGGTLVYTSISLQNGANLIFDQPTTVYVMNGISFEQSGQIAPASGLPKDLRIRIIGSASSMVGGNNSNNVTITGQIYAPNTDFLANNNAELRGTALFRTITAQNTLSLFYDITEKSVVNGLTRATSGIVNVE